MRLAVNRAVPLRIALRWNLRLQNLFGYAGPEPAGQFQNELQPRATAHHSSLKPRADVWPYGIPLPGWHTVSDFDCFDHPSQDRDLPPALGIWCAPRERPS